MIERIAKTLCRDGIEVSTIGFEGTYEIALRTLSGAWHEVIRYDSPDEALAGHAEFVRTHGGVAGLVDRLLQPR